MNKEHLLPIENSRLGIIGGSGFYSIDKIECFKELEVNTPYGKPSDLIRLFKILIFCSIQQLIALLA